MMMAVMSERRREGYGGGVGAATTVEVNEQ
jgi:hypothetical protein